MRSGCKSSKKVKHTDKKYVDSESESDQEMSLQKNDEYIQKELEVIDFGKNLFHYAGKNFAFIKGIDDQIYFRGKDVAEFLEYKDTNQAIYHNIHEKYRHVYKDIFRPVNFTGLKKLSHNEKNTIYISEPGLYQLIFSSKKKEAEVFRDYIFSTVLPSIRKHGRFDLRNPNQITLDTSFVKEFYEDESIANYINSNVVYLGVVGLYGGGILMKYGKSSRVFERDFSEHKRTFGNQFKLVHIEETDNNGTVEDIFKKVIKAKHLDVSLTFNKKNQTELFITTESFTINKAIEEIGNISLKNPLKAIKERDHKIKELSSINTNTVLLEQEKTKQKELELNIQKERNRELELEIRLFELKNKKRYDDISIDNKSKDDNMHILKKYNEANKGDVNKILETLFKYTGRHEDVILNKDLDMISCKTNIKKSSMIAYLRSLGSTKYKCSSISGHRKVSLTKYAKGKYIK